MYLHLRVSTSILSFLPSAQAWLGMSAVKRCIHSLNGWLRGRFFVKPRSNPGQPLEAANRIKAENQKPPSARIPVSVAQPLIRKDVYR